MVEEWIVAWREADKSKRTEIGQQIQENRDEHATAESSEMKSALMRVTLGNFGFLPVVKHICKGRRERIKKGTIYFELETSKSLAP